MSVIPYLSRAILLDLEPYKMPKYIHLHLHLCLKLACQLPLSKSRLLVNGKATCPRLVVKTMTACQSKDYLSKSRLLVNDCLSKSRLLVQVKAASQWPLVQGKASCPISKSRLLPRATLSED